MSSLVTAVLHFLERIFRSPSEEQPRPVSEPQAHPKPPQKQQRRPDVEPAIPSSPTRHKHRNDSAINQNNEHYKSLRDEASQEGIAMGKCFDESHQAYSQGDGAKAKELSTQGHAHQKRMNELNAEASAWIFEANNADRGPGEVDLHGLYVKEAISYTEKAIQSAQQRGDKEIRLIVGKGLHSSDQVAKLKPAIEDLIYKYKLVANLDEGNSGVLIVSLGGPKTGGSLGVDDITRKLERKDEGCAIM